MEDFYLVSLLPPEKVLSKIDEVRRELFSRLGMPSARMFPDMIPVALSPSYPVPPKESRYRIRIHSGFILDPVPAAAGEGVFLPLTDRDSWDEVRRDPLLADFEAHPPEGRGYPLSPYPGVFLGFSSDLPRDRSEVLLPRLDAPAEWKKCSLMCLRAAFPRTGEVLWEYFWEVPVVFRR